MRRHSSAILMSALAVSLFLGGSFFVLPSVFRVREGEGMGAIAAGAQAVIQKKIPVHLPTPSPLRAIYMTSWVAGTRSFRDTLVKLIDETELNAVVIDVKDYTGLVAYEPEDEGLRSRVHYEKRVPDMKEFIETLHNKGVYVIARIAVFQDPELVKERPEIAVKRQSDGGIWKDRKGITWIDAGAKKAWTYTRDIAFDAYVIGFDEINLDYIRFPSDGNMTDIAFPISGETEKPKVMAEFFNFIGSALRDKHIPASADLFGQTATEVSDLGIGQVLEDGLKYFDFVAPMVYPSHFGPGFHGHDNPAAVPYDIVRYSLDVASTRARAASTTPSKLRPWLQDFDLGADYTAEMVRAQIQAVYDAGLDSWMLWDPSNHYTKDALLEASSTTLQSV